MVGDFLFDVRSSQNRVLAEDVMIVREFADYSLSICCPRGSDIEVLTGFVRQGKGPRWTPATAEADFINTCGNDPAKQHVLFLFEDLDDALEAAHADLAAAREEHQQLLTRQDGLGDLARALDSLKDGHNVR